MPLCPGMIHENEIKDGEVLGGCSVGKNTAIVWQNGPAGPLRDGVNGVFVEDVIDAVIERLQAYQLTKYRGRATPRPICWLLRAKDALNARMQQRKEVGTLGTGEV